MVDHTKKLNILFLASWYPNKLEPQNGNFIQRHAEAVASICNVASLYVISSHDAEDYEIAQRWVNNVFEVIVYYQKTDKLLPFLKYRRYLKAHKLGFEEILKVFKKIDLTHLNVFYPAGIFALWLKKRFKIPFIITEHWTGFLDINPYKFNLFEKYFILKTAASASMICPVSNDLKNALQKFGIEGPFKVIPNVVDTNLFNFKEKNKSKLKKILHVSTLNDDHKNVTGILNVISKLSNKRTDFHLTLAGNKFGDKHLNYAKQFGIPDEMFTILDEIPLEDIAQIMQQQDIFVLFSNYENLPCVISEAHASGMVVVATDVGGVSEMIDPKNGFLINAREETALFEKLDYLLDHLTEYQPKEIRAAATERYGYTSVANQFYTIYKKVLAL